MDFRYNASILLQEVMENTLFVVTILEQSSHTNRGWKMASFKAIMDKLVAKIKGTSKNKGYQ